MNDAVIVDAVRTPVGKRNGALADIHPADLSAHVLTSLVERTGIPPAEIDDVVWGCVSQAGDQALNIGRTAVLAAAWPETVTATTVNRACGSSQQSVHFAAAGVIAGQYDFVIAGGVESMTRVPMGTAGQGGQPTPLTVRQRYGLEGFSQGVGAEMVAEKWSLSRTQLDKFSLRSHELAASAIDGGALDAQLAPIGRLRVDEGVRRGGTLE